MAGILGQGLEQGEGQSGNRAATRKRPAAVMTETTAMVLARGLPWSNSSAFSMSTPTLP